MKVDDRFACWTIKLFYQDLMLPIEILYLCHFLQISIYLPSWYHKTLHGLRFSRIEIRNLLYCINFISKRTTPLRISLRVWQEKKFTANFKPYGLAIYPFMLNLLFNWENMYKLPNQIRIMYTLYHCNNHFLRTNCIFEIWCWSDW